MCMIIKNSKFLTTVATINLLQNTKAEFAFVGKSNVGKSSIINMLANNKSLARTGKTAGVTKNINYFSINGGDFCFVGWSGLALSEPAIFVLLICLVMAITRQAKKNRTSGQKFLKIIS